MKRLEQLWSLVKFPKKALGGRRDSPKLRNEVDHLLNFATFLTFCSKIFSSVLLHSWLQEIWFQSLCEFDRLRPFLVIYRVFVTFFAAPEFVRVCSSLFEFVRVRSSSNRIIPSWRAGRVSSLQLFLFDSDSLPLRPALIAIREKSWQS